MLKSVLLCIITHLGLCQLSEEDRVAEYHARNHQWPPQPSSYIPDSPGWRSIFERRFQQTARIANDGDKYNAYMSTIHSALLAPNFTGYGWGITRAPQELVDELLQKLMQGIESPDTSTEQFDYPVNDEYPLEVPLMVDVGGELRDRAMNGMKHIHEKWSGVKLIPNNAYGLRVYRNQSNLQMHIDESSTHIISSILHVGHDAEGDPWPLVIESFDGSTNEVFLETGDMLLYESSKCFHGRPKRYNGKWYSSLFTHYYPADWDDERINLETHYRIPPDWHKVREETIEGLEKLVVQETSFKEPGCEHGWCRLENTKQWKHHPELKFGQVLSGDGNIRTLGQRGESTETELCEEEL